MLHKNTLLLWISLCFVACSPGSSTPYQGKAPDTSFTLPDGDIWLPPSQVDIGSNAPPLEVLSLFSVEPDSGPVAGGENVLLTGKGFVEGTRVFFGTTEANEVFVQGDGQITVRTPPHPSATVNIVVERPSGRQADLPEAYTYATEIEITSVHPASGATDGGTAITIHGSGFAAGTYVLVGDQVSPQVEVVSDTEILAVTPMGDEGLADVFVSIEGRVARLKNGFLFADPPTLTALTPAYGPISGGSEIVMTGKGLNQADLAVTFADSIQAEVSVTSPSPTVISPQANEPGPVPVQLHTPYGAHLAPNAFVYIDPDAVEASVLHCLPNRGPREGENEVHVFVQGFNFSSDSAVRFGDVDAEVVSISEDQHVLTVIAPPGTVGSVDVTVTGDQEEVVLSKGYTYMYALRIDSISPDEGSQEGGTEISVIGDGFFDGVEVRFGPMPAISVQRIDLNHLRVVSPAGAPGTAPVRAYLGDQEAVLDPGFTYLASGLQTFLLHPTRGARAGGTYFRIVGAGFYPGTRVFFGDREADIQLSGTQLIMGYSPRGIPGLADVRITSGGSSLTLHDVWLYFDPAAYLTGTWGAAVDEAVNITVIEASTGDPVLGAFVTIGADPATPFQGITDLNGQIVLSGPGLGGPVTVTAAKDGYSAQTIDHFDAENVTLVLYRLNPPQPGTPPPGNPMNPGWVEGMVHGLGKYVVVPPGDCSSVVFDPESGVPLCASCQVDADCNGGYCVTNQEGTSFCTRDCLTDADCPANFLCANMGWSSPRCLPGPGEKEIRCFVTPTSIFSGPPTYLTGSVIGDGEVYNIDARLGDVAVVCLGGVTDPDTDEFTALVMGVLRHGFVSPDQTTEDLNISLNIPLKGSLGLRLGNPLDPEKFPDRSIRAFLDIGSDGVIPIGTLESQDNIGEKYILRGLPEVLNNDLEDAKLVFYVELHPEAPYYLPSAEIILEGVKPEEVLHHTMLERGEAGTYIARSIGKAPNINAAARSDIHTFVVGAEGSILYWNGSGLSIQSSPTRNDLNGLTVSPQGVFYAIGSEGTVLTFNGLSWGMEDCNSQADLYGAASGDNEIYVVGTGVILRRTATQWITEGFGFVETLFDVAISDSGVVRAVGEQGTVFYKSGSSWVKEVFPTDADLFAIDALNDTFAVVGAHGTVVVREGSEDWKVIEAPTYDSLRSVKLLSDGSLLAGGPLGHLYHYKDELWSKITEDDHLLDVRVLYGEPGEWPTLVMGHHEVYLGPLLNEPLFTRPTLVEPLGHPPTLTWTVPDKPREKLNFIRMYDATGFPMWTVIAPTRDSVFLPDLNMMAGIQVLIPGTASMRVVRALSPDFNINSFSSKELNYFDWRSWTTISMDFTTD